ncbi:sorting nexin-8 [Plutella xylostella]|uniref:sorting nexin-8 n=1 Tax=Plutella xylostella TaxID=51655 RepID=UPI002032690F|nr:sorting nexin-8 [Plutella xylostella]XP_037965172.2 sorting nexin-8 [Plutella xylostella]
MSSSTEPVTYEELENTDVISVELVPERKGLILKHCEYYVSSRRHGTTVTRRYNEFSQLYDVLLNKYPYRAICSLPPKRVNVNGGSPRFLQRRRAALQRWLTLVARHPVLAHDADLRAFLCEPNPRLERPKHDEFMLAGCQDPTPVDMLTEQLAAAAAAEQDRLRLLQLGLERLLQIFDKVESRLEADRSDVRALGAGLTALSTASLPPSPLPPSPLPPASTAPVSVPSQPRLKEAARVASEIPDMPEQDDSGAISTFLLSVDAVAAARALAARLARPQPPSRQRYALKCQLQEAQVALAYGLAAIQALPELFCARAERHAEAARLWADIHATLDPSHSRQ